MGETLNFNYDREIRQDNTMGREHTWSPEGKPLSYIYYSPVLAT